MAHSLTIWSENIGLKQPSWWLLQISLLVTAGYVATQESDCRDNDTAYGAVNEEVTFVMCFLTATTELEPWMGLYLDSHVWGHLPYNQWQAGWHWTSEIQSGGLTKVTVTFRIGGPEDSKVYKVKFFNTKRRINHNYFLTVVVTRDVATTTTPQTTTTTQPTTTTTTSTTRSTTPTTASKTTSTVRTTTTQPPECVEKNIAYGAQYEEVDFTVCFPAATTELEQWMGLYAGGNAWGYIRYNQWNAGWFWTAEVTSGGSIKVTVTIRISEPEDFATNKVRFLNLKNQVNYHYTLTAARRELPTTAPPQTSPTYTTNESTLPPSTETTTISTTTATTATTAVTTSEEPFQSLLYKVLQGFESLETRLEDGFVDLNGKVKKLEKNIDFIEEDTTLLLEAMVENITNSDLPEAYVMNTATGSGNSPAGLLLKSSTCSVFINDCMQQLENEVGDIGNMSVLQPLMANSTKLAQLPSQVQETYACRSRVASLPGCGQSRSSELDLVLSMVAEFLQRPGTIDNIVALSESECFETEQKYNEKVTYLSTHCGWPRDLNIPFGGLCLNFRIIISCIELMLHDICGQAAGELFGGLRGYLATRSQVTYVFDFIFGFPLDLTPCQNVW